MTVMFRVDAGTDIGIGHFMRCLNLATALNEQGKKVAFACRTLPPLLHSLLQSQSIPVHIMESPKTVESDTKLDHVRWLSCTQTEDADSMVELLADKPIEWLVVDHYALDHLWESRLRKNTGKILVIDDLANRQHDCDVLIDQNFYHDMHSRYGKRVSPATKLLLGPEYALLQPAFSYLRENLRKRDGQVKNILVFFGGGDSFNCTELALDAIDNLAVHGFTVTVAIGGQHPSMASIKSRCHEKTYSLEIQSTEIARLMTQADLSIGAGGVSTYERCCLGLPAIVIAIAENQEPIAEAVASLGAVDYLGKQADITCADIQDALASMLSSPSTLVEMSENAQSIVDGKGVQRTCKEIAA